MTYSSCTIPVITQCNRPPAGAVQGETGRPRTGVLEAIARRLRGIAAAFKSATEPRFAPDETPVWLQSVLSNPRAIDLLRDNLRKRRGGEYLEFLLAYCRLDASRNPLQRFELVQSMIHGFVRDNAERPVRISEPCRRQLLSQWSAWAEKGRFPAGTCLPALEDAAMQVHEILARQGPAPARA